VALAREGDNGPEDVSTTVEDVLRGDWDHVAQELAAGTHVTSRTVGKGGRREARGGGGGGGAPPVEGREQSITF
jgi:hypothetical protein